MGKKKAPTSMSRRFALITLVVLIVVFGVAVAIIEYDNATTVTVDVAGSPHAYFVVVHGTANVTIPENQNAAVQLPSDTEIAVYAFPDASYQVTTWSVSIPTTTSGQNYVEFITGSDGSTITVSVDLSTSQ